MLIAQNPIVNCIVLNKLTKMSWITDTLNSSIGKKIIMAKTGLFLIIFLIVHLIGNISLLYQDGGEAFNAYAHFMKENPIIKAGELILFLGILVHVIQGLSLTLKNKAARSQGYAVANNNPKISKTSKSMSIIGTILLLFLIWHLYEFFRFKYFGIETLGVDANNLPNLYGRVQHEFTDEGAFHVPAYLIFMAAVGFHLYHGFQSAFQSLGINHKKYSPIIKTVGTAYSVIVPLLFAAIPVAIYFGFSIK
jgi:succinate dehydrogenase / fumarate reductase cytochrome b subunit